MRTRIVLITILFLFPMFSFAATDGYSVTYPADAQRVCPANSTMQGTQCFCNTGYKVSGTTCAKIELPPPGTNEIYEDILMQVIVNDELTCAKMGVTLSPDLDMCQKYKAATAAQREQWKKIPRPSTAQAMVTNPWAPPSQQTLSSVSASSSEALPPLAPPPPPPTATSTPTSTPAIEAPPPVAPESAAEEPAAKTLAELAKKSAEEDKPDEDSELTDAEKKEAEKIKLTKVDLPQVETPPVAPNPFAQIASAQASQSALNIASTTAGLVPLTERVAVPAAEPSPAPQTETLEQKPESPPSFFGRIAAWFASLF